MNMNTYNPVGSIGLEKPWRRQLARGALGVLLAGLTAVGACSGKKEQEAPPPPPVPVTIGVVEQHDVPVEIREIGLVEAYATIDVKSQVGGALTDVYFQNGQPVNAGDRLFMIDQRPFQASLLQAQANLSRDKIQAANARREANRVGQLFQRGAATRDELDTAQANADALDATAAADEAAVVNAKLQLSYCDIRSPIDGVMGMLKVNRGNLVKANDVPLVSINQIAPIYVNFSVPQRYLPEIRQQMAKGPLTVEANSPRDQMHVAQGTLTFIDNNIDPTTGMIKLRGTFVNSDHQLWPGEFVTTRLVVDVQKNVVVVPSPAVQASQEHSYVWVVWPDKTVQMQPVTVGRILNSQTVIAKGLQKGQTIVVDGQLRLVPGSRVELKPAVTALEPMAADQRSTASTPASAPASMPASAAAK